MGSNIRCECQDTENVKLRLRRVNYGRLQREATEFAGIKLSALVNSVSTESMDVFSRLILPWSRLAFQNVLLLFNLFRAEDLRIFTIIAESINDPPHHSIFYALLVVE